MHAMNDHSDIFQRISADVVSSVRCLECEQEITGQSVATLTVVVSISAHLQTQKPASI